MFIDSRTIYSNSNHHTRSKLLNERAESSSQNPLELGTLRSTSLDESLERANHS